jgi:hypothetical protein
MSDTINPSSGLERMWINIKEVWSIVCDVAMQHCDRIADNNDPVCLSICAISMYLLRSLSHQIISLALSITSHELSIISDGVVDDVTRKPLLCRIIKLLSSEYLSIKQIFILPSYES